jgi:hypothetical protein
MAFLTGLPKPAPFPSGRYLHTNPLRREAGLRLLTQDLPEPLRWAIIRAWRRPRHFDALLTALPDAQRQRPDDAQLMQATPRRLLLITFTEMEVSRRGVEAPQASILPAERNALLLAQGTYLRRLYVALARQIGEAAALAEFQRLLLQVS